MINQQRLIDTFERIVQIDSPCGHEDALAHALMHDLMQLGISARRDTTGNVIAHIEGDGTPLLLNAHMDTVEPGRGVVPVVDEGAIRSKGNTILGADNKVAIAALLEAVQCIIEQKLPHAPVDLIFTVSEEVANIGAIHLDMSQIRARHGFTFDSGDPIGTITVASPFYNRFDIELTGSAAHASRPEQAQNVLSVLQRALSQLSLGRVSPETVCNIGLLVAGHARNTVPGSLLIQGEVRSFLRAELDATTQHIVNAFQHAAEAGGVKATPDVVMENEGYLFADTDPFVIFTADTLRSLQLTPQLQRSYECYDANIFNSNGVRVLNIANAVQDMHTMKESIAIADLVHLTNIVLKLCERFSGFESQ